MSDSACFYSRTRHIYSFAIATGFLTAQEHISGLGERKKTHCCDCILILAGAYE